MIGSKVVLPRAKAPLQDFFHGSYAPEDVTFLLKPLGVNSVRWVDDLHEKERLLQSKNFHYSDLLSPEKLPSPEYLALFYRAIELNAQRVALDVLRLACHIRTLRPGLVTLVSFARAGTPVGILLRLALIDCYALSAPHYSISAIRGRGLDRVALDYIVARHEPQSVVFVDGWTAKGAIYGELMRSLSLFAQQRGVYLAPELFVLSDLAGVARASGTQEDYLIPSALLNATVSGLVSRSVLSSKPGVAEFHGCVFFEEWKTYDLSVWFIQRIYQEMQLLTQPFVCSVVGASQGGVTKSSFSRDLEQLVERYQVSDINLIKPGLGEATRAMLRRAPSLLILRDSSSACVQHLIQLATERHVTIKVDPSITLNAVAIIGSLFDV